MPCHKKNEITFLDKVTFIRHYAVDSCSTPWRVYVETGALADKNLVLGIVNTSPKDFVRFLLRPKGLRTARHGIKNLSRAEAASEEELIPDTAKLAADTIHLVTGWHVPTWGALGDAIFEIAQPLFQIGYYLLIANVTVDFAFDWYSGILLNPESKCNEGRFWFALAGNTIKFQPFTRYIPSGQAFIPANSDWNILRMHVGAGSWVIYLKVHARWQHGPVQEGTIFIQLRCGPGDSTTCGGTQAMKLEANTEIQYKRMVFRIDGPEDFNIYYAYTGASELTIINLNFADCEGFMI